MSCASAYSLWTNFETAPHPIQPWPASRLRHSHWELKSNPSKINIKTARKGHLKYRRVRIISKHCLTFPCWMQQVRIRQQFPPLKNNVFVVTYETIKLVPPSSTMDLDDDMLAIPVVEAAHRFRYNLHPNVMEKSSLSKEPAYRLIMSTSNMLSVIFPFPNKVKTVDIAK